MNHNIINEYLSFIKKEFTLIFKLTLGKQFNRALINTLIERYMMIRYYNEAANNKKDLIERVALDFEPLVKEMITDENLEQIKNIYSLFAYLPYFDDCYYDKTDREIIDFFFKDENLKLNLTDEVKEEIKVLLKTFRKNKEKFHRIINSNQFNLNEEVIQKGFYKLSLGHNVRISNLYSDYAIEKAYTSGIINEDKLLVLLIMASSLILNNAINLDFSRNYLIDLPSSLFGKSKKIERVLNIIDNEMAKKHLIINIKYEDYLNNRNKIADFIKRGFAFSVVIDYKFDEDYDNLIIFNYVFLFKDHQNYDSIRENIGMIKTNVIVL